MKSSKRPYSRWRSNPFEPLAALLLVAMIWSLNPVRSLHGQESNRPSNAKGDAGESIFAETIQPILRSRCWSCHGEQKQEAGLRLDTRNQALMGGDSGKSIVVGDSHSSRLIQYVSGLDPDHIMPPEGARLTPQEIASLSSWIDAGAAWPESDSKIVNRHWAYQPLSTGQVPTVRNPQWCQNPIDYFVLARLESLGIQPSPAADRATLIRRMYLDLHGLLPDVVEVDRYLSDSDPRATELLVDRLLDSPHFGERWGRHWLDMARYADSDGYEKDNPRPDAYRYRDWVIEALNKDMPFDQFTIEQIAGDLLPNASAMQRLATAFHRQTLTNTEGGADQEQFRVEACFDRTETTGSVWMGLTVGCARCHSHKYDAITQREYYQLFAFFNNGDEQTVVVPKSVDEVTTFQAAKADYDRRMADLQTRLRALQGTVVDSQGQWEAETREKLQQLEQLAKTSQPLVATEYASDRADVKFQTVEPGAFLVSGATPDSAVYTINGMLQPGTFRVMRLDMLPHATLPAKGPGRAPNGNFVLGEIVFELSRSTDFANPQLISFAKATADHEQPKYAALKAIDGNKQDGGWAIAQAFGMPHWIEAELNEPLVVDQPMFFRLSLHQNHGNGHTIGHCLIRLQESLTPRLDRLSDAVAEALKLDPKLRNENHRSALLEHYSRLDPITKELAADVDDLKKQEPAKPELVVRVLGQRLENPRKTMVLRRGEFLEPLADAVVQPGGFSVLHPMHYRHSEGDRLDLANWLVSKENPLTPRVTVNHVWRLLFGIGLVKTANDFGVRGEMPSHPELLDWLAAEFIGAHPAASQMMRAWSRKSLIKSIILSATYQQSAAHRPELDTLDPQNRLLARQNRLRVEGEIVRDIYLDAAGLLSRKVGGPSVYPALPPGIAELSYAGNFKWTPSEGGDRYRRGMYTFFKRTAPHPNLITFDCPDANLACVDRNRSNTPLQALVTLNNETFAEAARAMAARVVSAPVTPANEPNEVRRSRLVQMFRICLSRLPSEFELRSLEQLFSDAMEWFESHADDARLLVADKGIEGLDDRQMAAWIHTARVVLNLDEFITRE